jgi:hypothetical protein
LTNSKFEYFDPARRIEVDLNSLPFIILNDLFLAGDAFVLELEALKDAERKRDKVELRPAKKSRALKGETLAQRNPW